MEISKSLLLSCLRQLGYVLLRCVLIFWSPPCWFLTLWLSLFAIPLLHNACSYNLIGATGNFTLVVCPVMVPRLAIYGAATKPRASCGCTHKAVLLGKTKSHVNLYLVITSLLTPNLVTTIVCYPSFSWCLLLCNQNCATWKFFWVVCSVMVPRLAIYGAVMKPRASCGCTHKAVLLGTRWYRGF